MEISSFKVLINFLREKVLPLNFLLQLSPTQESHLSSKYDFSVRLRRSKDLCPCRLKYCSLKKRKRLYYLFLHVLLHTFLIFIVHTLLFSRAKPSAIKFYGSWASFSLTPWNIETRFDAAYFWLLLGNHQRYLIAKHNKSIEEVVYDFLLFSSHLKL